MAAHGVDGLVVIGGNGSLSGALALSDPSETGGDEPHRRAPLVVGVPASIDNDVGMTSLSIGVDTALNTIVDACDKISDTAGAHGRAFIVEVMGRSCGYLACTAAIATGADAVLYPEAGLDEDAVVAEVVRAVRAVRARPSRSQRVLCIKAEGVPVPVEHLKQRVDDCLRGDAVGSLETRVTVLGHVVRGGRPSAFDRLLASRLAHVAVRAILAGEHRRMAAWMLPLEPPAAVAHRSADDPYCWLVDLEAVLAETDRLLSGASPLVQWRARVLAEIEDVLAL
jgi:6-phosphofructokinase 1